jgi:uncharacterized Zn-binding protein involved in type VI secretion
MSPFAAKQGDTIVAVDVHLVQPPEAVPPVPGPYPFDGIIDANVSDTVTIEGMPAAIVGSTATNTPPHIPIGGTFVKPPSNQGTILTGSATVTIGGLPAARAGDTALTCNDPVDLPVGTVVAAGTVSIGG